jgi:hypothetical protein
MHLRQLAMALGVSAAVLGPCNAHAYQIFFGEDPNSSATVPLSSTPSSSSAESAFKSQLTGIGTETFEAQAAGQGTPLILTFPGAGTATLSGGDGIVAAVPSGTASFGRYSVPSATSTQFWEVEAGGTGDFAITFANPTAALGFFGIDIGDFGGQLVLALSNGDSLTVNNTIGTAGSNDGSVLFFGLIAQNPAQQFTSVRFNTTIGQGDVFAFDNFTIASQEQVCTVNCPPLPEPAPLALLGIAVAGGLGVRRWKHRA